MATVMTETASLAAGAFSDEGKRPNQEDRFLVTEIETRDGLTATLALVADGIGGQSTGELASRIAQETIPQYLKEIQPTASEMTRALAAAIEEANRRIYEESLKSMDHAGMGTTCTAVAIIGKRLYLAHVGDSRAYLLRNGALRQLTIDHTWAEEALRHGRSLEEIRNHPNRGVLKRFLGIEPYVEVDTRYKMSSAMDDFEDAMEKPLFLENADTIMLCTDGVSDVLHDQQIESILSKFPAPKAAEELVKAALNGGASDNVTAVVLDMPQAQKGGAGMAVPGWAWGAVGAMLLILLLAAGGFFLLKGRGGEGSKAAAANGPAALPALTPGAAVTFTPIPVDGGEAGVITAPGGIQVAATEPPTATPMEAAAGEEEPTPTIVPTPTAIPTRIVRPQPSSRPSTGGNSGATSSQGANITITGVQPPENELLKDKTRVFEWKVLSGELKPQQKYELVFYKCDQDPNAGFSPIGATKDTKVTVNLEGADNDPSLPFDPGEWCWAIFAGHERKNGTWDRDRLLFSGRKFIYERPGGGGGDKPPGGGNPPGGGEPPGSGD